MDSARREIPGCAPLPADLPEYAARMFARHRVHAEHFAQIVAAVPLDPSDVVLDVASGDGTYAALLAQRLDRRGRVVALDIDPAYLRFAGERIAQLALPAPVELARGDALDLSFADASFDLVWCAQSLQSLPEISRALREWVRVTRPGKLVAILENDELHRVVLSWEPALELAIREAELRALQAKSGADGDRMYSGRQLAGLLAEAGLANIEVQSFALSRTAPLDPTERYYLSDYLLELYERVASHLAPDVRERFARIIDPRSPSCLLDAPDFQVTYTDTLAWGRVMA
jgi:SAM-dependent methyltransferase